MTAKSTTSTKKSVKTAKSDTKTGVSAVKDGVSPTDEIVKDSSGAFDQPSEAVGDIFSFGSTNMTDIAKMLGEQSEKLREQMTGLTEVVRERAAAAQHHFQEANTDLMNTARDELHDMMQLQHDLVNADNITDMLELQRDFFSSLMETRMQRMRDLTGSMSSFTQENMDITRTRIVEPMMETMKSMSVVTR